MALSVSTSCTSGEQQSLQSSRSGAKSEVGRKQFFGIPALRLPTPKLTSVCGADGYKKPKKRYLHEIRNTCFILDICSFLNSLCLLGLKLFSVPLHLIPRLPLRCSETSSAGVWCCLLPCSWCSRSLWSSRCSERGKNEAKTQAEKQSKGRGVTGGMRTGHCRGVTASLWKT